MSHLKTILIWLGVLVFVTACGAFYLYLDGSKCKGFKCNEEIACTLEAKLCPDGSYVGRSGPNCKFAACPIIENKVRYPLIKELNWRNAYFKEINYFQQSADIKIQGKIIESESTENNIRFKNYYDYFLQLKGWIDDPNVSADGGNINMWGYKKGNSHIIMTAVTKELTGRTLECPCSYEFSIFWDDPEIRFVKEDDISEWKTYQNYKLGFEIKYPFEWKVDEWEIEPLVLFYDFNEKEEYEINSLLIEIYENLSELPKNSEDLNLKQYLQNSKEYTDLVEISFAGKNAYEVYEPMKMGGYTILVQNGEKIFKLQNSHRGKNELSDFDRSILSTFKFIQ